MTERDGRLRSLRRDELDADGQRLWDSLTEGRGARLVDAGGGQGMAMIVERLG